METLYKYIDDWNDLVLHKSDKRVSNWFMMSSPIPGTTICLLYLLFVIVGPRLMRNREPFQINKLLVVYNFAMVIWSTYIFEEVKATLLYLDVFIIIINFYFNKFLASGWWRDYSFGCEPMDYSDSPQAMRVRLMLLLFIRDDINYSSFCSIY
jgi:elongation of very long chain fatty acids protein 7